MLFAGHVPSHPKCMNKVFESLVFCACARPHREDCRDLSPGERLVHRMSLTCSRSTFCKEPEILAKDAVLPEAIATRVVVEFVVDHVRDKLLRGLDRHPILRWRKQAEAQQSGLRKMHLGCMRGLLLEDACRNPHIAHIGAHRPYLQCVRVRREWGSQARIFGPGFMQRRHRFGPSVKKISKLVASPVWPRPSHTSFPLNSCEGLHLSPRSSPVVQAEASPVLSYMDHIARIGGHKDCSIFGS